MNNRILRLKNIACAAGIVLLMAGGAEAAVVTIDHDFQNTTNIVGGENLGGLNDTVNGNNANGAADLNFLLTIDDTADTGATFEANFVLSGLFPNGNTNVRSNAGGTIVFDADNNNRQLSLTFTMDDFTQTGGPAATLAFQGIRRINMDGNWDAVDDILDLDGTDFFGTGGTNPQAGFNWNVGEVLAAEGTEQFGLQRALIRFEVTATAVPEPSSFALMGVGLACFAGRRRRRRAKAAA